MSFALLLTAIYLSAMALYTGGMIYLINCKQCEKPLSSKENNSKNRDYCSCAETRPPSSWNTSTTRRFPAVDKECMICHDEPVNIRFMPCGHGSMCRNCGKDYLEAEHNSTKKCPDCRRWIDYFQKV